MNGYGKDFGVSYRTLHRIFEVLQARKVRANFDASQRPDEAEAAPVDYDNENDFGLHLISNEETSSPFTFMIEVSMMEIYNEQVNDLLSPSQGSGSGLEIRQGTDGSVYVPGLRQVPVSSLQDVMEVFGQGSSNRATTTTNLNERSSRSHLILTVTVTTTLGDGAPVRGKLNLVDLAGSEKVSKSGVSGAALKEAQHINKSLAALGDVLEALDQKSKHVPYRNSKLTFLLQDSLSGLSRTMMIVTVCPTEYFLEETLFTLGFATRVRNITVGAARRNTASKQLEETLKSLRNELKEAKKAKLYAEESLLEMKKENKRLADKFSNQLEGKSKSFDDVKKSAESQLQVLARQNMEVQQKLGEEKEGKQKVVVELEGAHRALRRQQDLVKEMTREKERLSQVVNFKSAEIDQLKSQIDRLTAGNLKSSLTRPASRRVGLPVPAVAGISPGVDDSLKFESLYPRVDDDESVEWSSQPLPAPATTERRISHLPPPVAKRARPASTSRAFPSTPSSSSPSRSPSADRASIKSNQSGAVRVLISEVSASATGSSISAPVTKAQAATTTRAREALQKHQVRLGSMINGEWT